jgi:hypothetical protein
VPHGKDPPDVLGLLQGSSKRCLLIHVILILLIHVILLTQFMYAFSLTHSFGLTQVTSTQGYWPTWRTCAQVTRAWQTTCCMRCSRNQKSDMLTQEGGRPLEREEERLKPKIWPTSSALDSRSELGSSYPAPPGMEGERKGEGARQRERKPGKGEHNQVLWHLHVHAVLCLTPMKMCTT